MTTTVLPPSVLPPAPSPSGPSADAAAAPEGRPLAAALTAPAAALALVVGIALLATSGRDRRLGDLADARLRFRSGAAAGLGAVALAATSWGLLRRRTWARPLALLLASVGLMAALAFTPTAPAVAIPSAVAALGVIVLCTLGTTVVSRRHPTVDRDPSAPLRAPAPAAAAAAAAAATASPSHPTAATRVSTIGLVATGLLVVLALLVRSRTAFGLIALAAVFVPLEKVVPLHPRPARRALWKTDAVHFLVNNVLIIVGLVVVLGAVLLGLGWLVQPAFRAAVAAQPWWLQFIEAYLVTQLSFYGAHRAAHEIGWLWRFHKVHHSPTELDWLAAARLHPIDAVLGQAAVVVPLYAFGFSAATFGAFLVFNQLNAIFVHSNVRLRFGPLRWLLNTPEFHHWHHADEPSARNVNLCGAPLVDLLFGTCYLPHRWPSAYGAGEPVPPTYLGQLAWPFRRAGR